jgi:hypothetical protein
MGDSLLGSNNYTKSNLMREIFHTFPTSASIEANPAKAGDAKLRVYRE